MWGDTAVTNPIVHFWVVEDPDRPGYEVVANIMRIDGDFVQFFKGEEFHYMVHKPLGVTAVRHDE